VTFDRLECEEPPLDLAPADVFVCSTRCNDGGPGVERTLTTEPIHAEHQIHEGLLGHVLVIRIPATEEAEDGALYHRTQPIVEDGGSAVVTGSHRIHEDAVTLTLTQHLGPRVSNNPEGSLDRRGHGRRVPRPVAHQAKR
jgi:hypothetical protein